MQERTIYVAPAPPPTRKAMLLIAAFLVAACFALWWKYWAQISGIWLEDLPVYTLAVNNWLAGRNPYNASLAPLYFLYPPAFLFLAGLASHLFPAHWGPTAYCMLSVASLCALPLVLARFFFRQQWLGPWFALLLFFYSSRLTSIDALCGMNIASMLYCLAFVVAVSGLRRNRWHWFYMAVFLAANIKITFLALLLLPLLAGRRQWERSVLCGAAVVLANLGERALWPALYSGYQFSLLQGIVKEQAFGYGVFGILAAYHYRQRGVGVAAYAVSGLLAVLVVVLMFLLWRRLQRSHQLQQESVPNGIWLALVVMSVVLVNPRVMQYDMDIALFAGFVLLVYGLKTQRLLTLTLLLPLPSIAVPFVVLNPHLHGIYETFLVWTAFGLGYWRLRQDSKAEKTGALMPVEQTDASA